MDSWWQPKPSTLQPRRTKLRVESLEPRIVLSGSSVVCDCMATSSKLIDRELIGSLTAYTGLPEAGGIPRTTEPMTGIAGTAPFASVRSVTVDGNLAEFDPFMGQWSLGAVTAGAPRTLVDTGQVWEFLDAGQVPDPGWQVDNPNWTDSGVAPLGYGEDESTEVAFIDTDPNEAGTQKNIATYFRHAFEVTNADEWNSLTLHLRRDDGAIVYLNGEEIVRDNLPAGDVLPTTTADATVSGGDEDTFFPWSVDPALLVDGQNVLAVEVHQTNDSSSDVIFDLRVEGTVAVNVGNGDGIDLQPGLNPIRIEAYDGPNGTGNLVETITHDVWFDNGVSTSIGGNIREDTVWTKADSPYVVTEDIIVFDGTVTIEPGTTVFFNPGTGLSIRNVGHVEAIGTPTDRIRFMHNPAEAGSAWDGLTIRETQADNRFEYADFQNGDAQGNAVYLIDARALFNHVTWFDINNQVIDMQHPNLVVRNSHIPSISGDETIHLVGLDEGEELVFECNTIGKNLSGNDVVDMAPDSTSRETIYFRNNTFLGSFDDGVDTDGMRVVFEGNTFTDFHLDSARSTTSNAISTGHQNVGETRMSSELTITGNTFYDVDHALLLKDFSFATFTNNTVVKATIGGVQFQELSGSSVIGPGRGADIDGNIFWETPLILEALHPDSEYTLRRSIVTSDLVTQGFGNIASDPKFVDAAFTLAEDSPARDAGPWGTDMGSVPFRELRKANASNLFVTELNYNPAAGDQLQFIELWNSNNDTLDLSGVAFTDGIDFEFPQGSTIGPGERIAIVKNIAAFESQYGEGRRIVGEFTDRFSAAGGTVTLTAADGGTLQQFTYGDSGSPGWPDAADGGGATLVVTNITGDLNQASNWTASLETGGSPAEQEAGPTIVHSEFEYQTSLAVALSFSESVDADSLPPAEFEFNNVTTGQVLAANQISIIQLSPSQFRIEISPSRAEADGDWQLRMNPGSFASSKGQASLTNYSFDFFHLAGDYNRDRSVDAADFTLWRDARDTQDLRANGDRLGDSVNQVDFADFLVLSANFGKRLD